MFFLNRFEQKREEALPDNVSVLASVRGTVVAKTLFDESWFESESPEVNRIYNEAVLSLETRNFNKADRLFRRAAAGGHISAFYNLAILHGQGLVTPLDPGFGIECYYKAADAGHPKALVCRQQLDEAAARKLTVQSLAARARMMQAAGGFDALLMLSACCYFEAQCRQYDAFDEVIGWELDAANHTENPIVERFIRRTCFEHGFYRGKFNRFTTGSATDQIIDGLNEFSVAMHQAGIAEERVIFARCMILGHLIQSSSHGARARPLLSMADFLKES